MFLSASAPRFTRPLLLELALSTALVTLLLLAVLTLLPTLGLLSTVLLLLSLLGELARLTLA